MSHARQDHAESSRGSSSDQAFHSAERSAAADRVIRGIRDRIKLLGRHPGMGQARDTIAAELRNFPVGSDVIFYRIEESEVVVLRILHGAQDAEAQF